MAGPLWALLLSRIRPIFAGLLRGGVCIGARKEGEQEKTDLNVRAMVFQCEGVALTKFPGKPCRLFPG